MNPGQPDDLTPLLDVHRITADAERDHQAWEPQRVARYALRKMSAAQRDAYLLYLLTDQVKGTRRARVRQIEERAEQAARRAEWEARAVDRRATERAEQAERHAYYEAHPSAAPRRSRWFKAWAETPEGKAGLAAEAERNAREAARRAEIDTIGVEAWYSNEVNRIISDYRSAVRLELTEELLGAEFALGDGRSVTWADADAGDHTQRIGLLLGNARGNVAAAARHRSAISMLAEHGVTTLREVAERELRVHDAA